MKRNDGLLQYMVYLPKIKLINRLVTKEKYENYTKHLFKVYVFNIIFLMIDILDLQVEIDINSGDIS